MYESKLTFLFWIFIIISPQFIFTVAGEEHIAQSNEEKPSFAKMVADTISILKSSHKSSWDRVKNIITEMQLQFFPPNLDFKGADETNQEGGRGARGKMKEAAKKSFGTSKETVEESAKSAAKVMGEAAHMTAQKVKESMADKDHESDAEL